MYEKPTSRMEVRGVEALGACVCVCVCVFLSLLCSFCLLVGLGVKKLSFSLLVGLGVKKHSHLKLVCFVSVSSVLFLSSCGPWCQKTLILSWFALCLSLLRYFCPSCGPWCQKNPIFLRLSLLCFFCLLVGLGVNKLSLLCSFCLLVGLGVKKLSS